MTEGEALPHPEPLDGDRVTGYHRTLFVLLCGATMVEGFDATLTALVLPYLGREFEAGTAALGAVLSLLGMGTILGFAPIRLADRYGRRPLFLLAIAGYSALTAATAFSRSLDEFVALQIGARMLMVTELALAYVILSEELPARLRGRANGLLGAFASVGAVLPAVALPLVADTELGWRGLYLMGGALLPLLPLYWLGVRETERFLRSTPRSRGSLREELARTASVARGQYRRRFLAITCLWFTINFWSGSALFFFAYYTLGDRGWAPERLGVLYPLGGLAGFVGYAVAGRLMDLAGRRAAASAYLMLGTAFVVLCYQSSSDARISAGYVGLMFVGGIWAIAATMSAELFPAELRATANGVAHNLLGRWGMAIAPALAGAIAEQMGSTAHAITILSGTNLLCVPVIWRMIPETKGCVLDATQPSAPQNSKPASTRNSRGSP